MCGGGCVGACAEMLWAETEDSWIASSGRGGFTPSEEHRRLMSAKTVTIGHPQTHIIRRGGCPGDLWRFEWAGMTP